MARTLINDHAAGPSTYGGRYGERFRVLCSDGRARIATVTAADADTVWTITGRVTVNGRTVTGSIYHRGNLSDGPVRGRNGQYLPNPEYRFAAHTYRANGDALPAWTDSGIVDGAA